ncbi:MAG: alternative ribosome rescue aminoacyl-tRNA hydrolase ArfB [Myxococcota bacterium]
MFDLSVSPRCTIPGADLSWRAIRASGPGGQNVNKVATKVALRFDLANTCALSAAAKARFRARYASRIDAEGAVVVTSQATRIQSRNLEDAREKLAAMVRAALVVPKRRKKTKPSRAAKRRRLEAKRRQSDKKRNRTRIDP